MLSPFQLSFSHQLRPSASSLLLLLAACTPPKAGGDQPATTDTGTPPAPYVVEDPDPTTLDLDTDQAAEAINTILATVLTYEGSVVFDVYDEIMTYGDDECPPVQVDEGTGASLWDADCTSNKGATFSGFVSQIRWQHGNEIEAALRAESTVTLPTGAELILGGAVNTLVNTNTNTWSNSISGVVSYDGPAATGTWLESNPDLLLTYSLTLSSANALQTADIDGSVGSLQGTVSAVDLNSLVLAQTADFPCPIEPSGWISLRDANGVWADVLFDVQADEEEGYTVDEADCDGCGTLWFDGEDLGQVCVDTAPLFETPMPPW